MTYQAKPVPQALTIAGSDSGGGAGIQADLKTFQERRVFGTSVIVAVTAQNTLGVQGIHKVPVEFVNEQMRSVFSDFEIGALKTGMLPDAEIMRAVAAELRKHPEIPVVVDPVMIAKGALRSWKMKPPPPSCVRSCRWPPCSHRTCLKPKSSAA